MEVGDRVKTARVIDDEGYSGKVHAQPGEIGKITQKLHDDPPCFVVKLEESQAELVIFENELEAA